MNNTFAILVSSIVSFIFGLSFMFVIMLFSENNMDIKSIFGNVKKELFSNDEDTGTYDLKHDNNSLSLIHDMILENKKKLVLLFISCLIVGLYCGNSLMQGITMNR